MKPSKPFDLEAAKRGEPIQVDYDCKWMDVHFVGMSAIGHVVVEGHFNCGQFSTWNSENVRMAPKKRTVYVNVYDQRIESGSGFRSAAFDTEELANHNARINLLKLYSVAQPVEIEE